MIFRNCDYGEEIELSSRILVFLDTNRMICMGLILTCIPFSAWILWEYKKKKNGFVPFSVFFNSEHMSYCPSVPMINVP